MITIPENAKPINVDGSTVDFLTFTENDIIFFYFDTSDVTAPEPMQNAMAGLSLLKSSQDKLIMVNHQKPMGLFGKLQEKFDIEVFDLADGNYQMIFSYKAGISENADLTDTHCGG
jgi:hypothetical protein